MFDYYKNNSFIKTDLEQMLILKDFIKMIFRNR